MEKDDSFNTLLDHSYPLCFTLTLQYPYTLYYNGPSININGELQIFTAGPRAHLCQPPLLRACATGDPRQIKVHQNQDARRQREDHKALGRYPELSQGHRPRAFAAAC